jgi:signal transduction histidine kinase
MKIRNPLIVFYLLSGYIILQVLWWIAYQLRLNEQLRSEQLEVGASSESILIIQEEFNKKFWMILGEGMVFTILLLFGMYVMFRVLRQQVSLAKAQRNFLLTVTHELKTPIASITLLLETMQKRDLDEETKSQLIEDALSETNRLATMTENMLLSSRVEKAQELVNFETIDLSALVDGAVAKVSRTTGQNHNFKTAIRTGIQTVGDNQYLEALVLNLLINAIKYSPEKSEVEVSLDVDKDQAVLEVKDQGLGIGDTDKERVFRKFYRVENEEIRNSKGSGLGLFLVREIAKAHGGSVRILDNKPKGTIFRVALSNGTT